MILHGTSAARLDSILKRGLLTRRMAGGFDNWQGVMTSSPDRVYFSYCYAPAFACVVAHRDWGRVPYCEGVVFDTEPDEANFCADEDAILFTAVYKDRPFPVIQRYCRIQAGMCRDWAWSADRVGSFAHKGPVPVDRIKGYVRFRVNEEAFTLFKLPTNPADHMADGFIFSTRCAALLDKNFVTVERYRLEPLVIERVTL